jgi:hypothetical protein
MDEDGFTSGVFDQKQTSGWPTMKEDVSGLDSTTLNTLSSFSRRV